MTSSEGAAALLALALTLGCPAALAQTHAPTAQELETARTLYKEGKALRAQGDLRGALDKLRAAHALGNTPVTGIELARTYASAGKLVEAREVCLGVARTTVASDETAKSVEARVDAAKLAEELKPRIATLVVDVAGLAAGEAAHLTIDGAAVPDVAETEEQKVNPGVHDLVARAGEGAAARELRGVVELKEGQTQRVTLAFPAPPVQAPPAETPPLAPSEPAKHGRSRLVTIGLATTLAGVAVGSVAGMVALTKKSELDGECPAGKCDTQNGGRSDLHAAYGWAAASTVSFVVGGVGALTAIVGLVMNQDDRSQAQTGVSLWLGTGAAGLHGRF
jgi:hypothetical protein